MRIYSSINSPTSFFFTFLFSGGCVFNFLRRGSTNFPYSGEPKIVLLQRGGSGISIFYPYLAARVRL